MKNSKLFIYAHHYNIEKQLNSSEQLWHILAVMGIWIDMIGIILDVSHARNYCSINLRNIHTYEIGVGIGSCCSKHSYIVAKRPKK